MYGSRSFVFLNEPGDLNKIKWDGPQREKLWRYNLHYFDDLNALRANERKVWHEELIPNWIDENPPSKGVGWESYPLSLRIVNWIKWELGDGDLPESALHSLAIQLRWLSKRLEVHLLGNHLFANAKALVFGGLFFEGKEADRWLKKGLRILHKEIKEQILPDGGHFERSTMYHALVLEDLLDLINVTKCFSDRLRIDQNKQVSCWYGVAEKMHFWLKNMCHSDGEISFFNDAAFDVAPSVAELDSYFKRLGIQTTSISKRNLTFLKDSGYIRITNGSSVVLLDVAKIGPDYLPGHAHADTLSFELSIDNQRVVVNSGTSCYGSSSERLKQRGTLSHNTVAVNGENSSEIWRGFRVARRAYPIELQVLQNEHNKATEVQCAHDGYSRLIGKPKHFRKWRMDEESFLIEDYVCETTKGAEARYHFHPEVHVHHEKNKNSGTIQLPNKKKIDWKIIEGLGRLEASTWHPRFGVSISNVCLVVELIRGVSKINFRYPSL
jgi:uncharacterized heparinase superfamily protein